MSQTRNYLKNSGLVIQDRSLSIKLHTTSADGSEAVDSSEYQNLLTRLVPGIFPLNLLLNAQPKRFQVRHHTILADHIPAGL